MGSVEEGGVEGGEGFRGSVRSSSRESRKRLSLVSRDKYSARGGNAKLKIITKKKN